MRVAAVAALVLLSAPGASAGAGDPVSLEQLRRGDVRLAAIGHRLVTANAALCADRSPAPGIVIHAIDQYDVAEQGEVRRVFGFATAIGVEGVVAGGAAERAGVRAGDSIVSVDGRPVPVASGGGHVRTRDVVLTLIEGARADAPLTIVVRRGGTDRTVRIAPSPGCRSVFELQPGARLEASADGRIVQLSGAFLDRFDDAGIAVVVAHELSHNILRHRLRLDTANVSRGLLRELGRNGRLFRQSEDEADRLSVHLLRNAGWDPARAVTFWRGPGARIAGGVFYSRTHSSPARRADLIAQEIAALPSGAPIPYLPPVLAARDAPLR